MINYYKYDKDKNMYLNNKRHSVRNSAKNSFSFNSFTINHDHDSNNYYLLRNNILIDLTQENSSSSFSKKDSLFTIKNLFMKNDS